jgi:hypothetical protein
MVRRGWTRLTWPNQYQKCSSGCPQESDLTSISLHTGSLRKVGRKLLLLFKYTGTYYYWQDTTKTRHLASTYFNSMVTVLACDEMAVSIWAMSVWHHLGTACGPTSEENLHHLPYTMQMNALKTFLITVPDYGTHTWHLGWKQVPQINLMLPR